LFKDLGEARLVYPPVFVVSTCDCLLTGYRTILTKDGTFFNDDTVTGHQLSAFLAKLRKLEPFLNENSGLRGIGSSLFVMNRAERPIVSLKGSVAILCSHEPSNYGSWLFRVLPKLITLRKYAISDSQIVVHAPPKLHDYLRLCGLGADQIIHHDLQSVYHIDHAIIPSLRNNQAFLDDETCTFYDELRQRHGIQQSGRRVYVSRLRHATNGMSSRIMLNEIDLIGALRRLNFDIVEPETLSAQEQIATFAEASMVVGASGSGMFNVVFCQPGTKVIDIESEPHWIHAHVCLFTSRRLRFGLFEGKADPTDTTLVHRRWSVNIRALLARVEAFARST
jgi:capsular polysaccharide biosynthesis protein